MENCTESEPICPPKNQCQGSKGSSSTKNYVRKSFSGLLWSSSRAKEVKCSICNKNNNKSDIRRCQTAIFTPQLVEATSKINYMRQTSLSANKMLKAKTLNKSVSRIQLYSLVKHVTPYRSQSNTDIGFTHRLPQTHSTESFSPIKNSNHQEEISLCKSCDALRKELQEKPSQTFLCKLCLEHLPESSMMSLGCTCMFCKECMLAYLEFEVRRGCYEIFCPDSACSQNRKIGQDELEQILPHDLVNLHSKFRSYREVDRDPSQCWCPSIDCDTVCYIPPFDGKQSVGIVCPKCSLNFCSKCKGEWHSGNCKRIQIQDTREKEQIIKHCPNCETPIEKVDGCAQMMCKSCQHVFCWYCLASLDDDFLLRHYDNGPCKNKLGHSRASVIWHRTQVIALITGIGLLFLVTSPILIAVAPCFLCCKNSILGGFEELSEKNAEDGSESSKEEK